MIMTVPSVFKRSYLVKILKTEFLLFSGSFDSNDFIEIMIFDNNDFIEIMIFDNNDIH